MLYLLPFLSIWQYAAWSISCPAFTIRLLASCMINLLLCHFYLSVSLLPDLSHALFLLSNCRPAAWPSLALPLLSVFRPAAWSTSCPAQRWYDTNGRFQMQGGKNWIFMKEINGYRFFWDSHLLEIWSNHFFPLWDCMEGAWLWTQYRNECINVPISKLRIETKPKRFGVFQIFCLKKGTFLFFSKTLKPNQNVLLCSRIF